MPRLGSRQKISVRARGPHTIQRPDHVRDADRGHSPTLIVGTGDRRPY